MHPQLFAMCDEPSAPIKVALKLKDRPYHNKHSCQWSMCPWLQLLQYITSYNPPIGNKPVQFTDLERTVQPY